MASYGSLQDWWYLALLSPKEELLWSDTAGLYSNVKPVDYSKLPDSPGLGNLPIVQASKFMPPYSSTTSTIDIATGMAAPVLRVTLRGGGGGGSRVVTKMYRVYYFLIEGYQ